MKEFLSNIDSETIQVFFVAIGVVTVIFFLSDCAIKMDAKTEERKKEQISVEMIKNQKIDSLSAKCKVYYE